MEKQLSDFTVVELKAIAYDLISQLEITQNNLKIIHQELTKRLNTNQPPKTDNPTNNQQIIINSLPLGSIYPV